MKFARIKPSELEKLLANVLPLNLNVLVAGRAGIGKSSIVREVASKLGYKIIDIRAINMDIGDIITRVPHRGQNGELELHSVLANWIKKLDNKTLLLLDEFDKSTELVLRMFYQILLDREIEGYKLPELPVVAIINTQEDGAFTILEKPLLDRFHLKVELTSDFNDFLTYALEKGFDSRLLAFIQANSEWLYKENEEQLISTPRRLEFLSNMIKNKDNKEAVFISQYVISEEFSREFEAFLELYSKIDAEAIFTGKKQLASDFAVRIAQIVAVSNYIANSITEKEQINAVNRFYDRLNSEERLFFLQTVITEIAKARNTTRNAVKEEILKHTELVEKIYKDSLAVEKLEEKLAKKLEGGGNK